MTSFVAKEKQNKNNNKTAKYLHCNDHKSEMHEKLSATK